MTKKWLMYAVTGILCCGLIGFAVAKQTNASGKTALDRAKAALSNPSMSATNPSGSNITATDLNAMVRKADVNKGVSSSAQAPEGWVSPQVAQERAVAGKAPATENLPIGAQVLTKEQLAALTGARPTPGFVQPMSLQQERDQLLATIENLQAQGRDYSAQKARFNEIVAQLNDRAPRRPLDQGGETCALAPVITSLPYCDSGNTLGAVNDYTDGAAGDLVYSYTPAAAGNFIVSLCGNTSYDTRIIVYSGGCPGAGGTLVINQDDFCGVQSCVTIAGAANTLYYLIVDGFTTGSEGSYTIKVEADAGQGCSQLATCPGAIGRCCYGAEGLTCTNNTETDCAGLGGVWNGTTTCELEPCPNCNVVCAPTDIVEAEEVDYCASGMTIDPNGGCNVTPNTYTEVACGDTVCALGYTCDEIGGGRDTDWFRFTVTTPSILSYSAIAKFPNLQMLLLDGDYCTNFILYGSNFIDACGQIGNITTTCLPPGDYIFWAGVGAFSGQPLGGNDDTYRAWVTCTPCELPFGRCCYNGGSACADLYETDCAALGGTLDVGLSCATDPCANTCVDFTLNAPGSHTANTLGNGDDCSFRVGEDYGIEVIIPNDGRWTFSLCGGSTWDTYLYLSTGCCTGLLTQVDDFCGLQSEIQCYSLTAGTYYIDVEPFSSGGGGDFTLNVTECLPCVLDCQPTDIVEPDDFTGYCANNGATDPNGGNNVVPPAFTDIACGDWVCAQSFTCPTGYRDTDWFRFSIAQTQDVTVTVESAFNNLLFAIVDINTSSFVAFGTLTDCNAGQGTVTACLPAGTYAAFGAPNFFTGMDVPMTYRINVECTAPSCSYGRCCYNGGSSCAVTTDLDCAALAGTFDVGLDCTSPCVNLCETACGPNDGTEGDESLYCGSFGATDPNGGCNSTPQSFQNIVCGDTVCGEAFTCDDIGYRDTDWYQFTVDIPAAVTVSVKPEFSNMLFGIVDPAGCVGPFFITNAFVTDCQVWSSVTANLNPGTYVAFAAPGVFSGQPYGGVYNTYRLALSGICALEPCEPITDLSAYVVTAGAPPVADHIKLFWTAPQTDDYKVWSTTNPMNDGNPDDGADVDFTLEATLFGVAAGPATWDAPAGFFGLPLIGAPKIYVVTTVCTPFQAPTGRCCYAGGCQDVTEEDCLGLGGTWGQFLTCANNPCPLLGGETVNDAIVISALPYEAASSTIGMANDYDETCPYSGSLSGDQVFSYTPAGNETINLSLCLGTTDYDTKVYIYQNTVTPGAPFACNDDACSAPNYASWVSQLLGVALTGGNTYYIVVDGYGSAEGNYTLQVTN